MFKIPNNPDTSYIDQSEPDAGDFAALGERSTGVLTGCAVTAQGTPALFVDVASGTVVVGGTSAAVSSGSLAVSAGESSPRFDLVVVNSAGTKSILKGTASTNPAFPSAFDPATYALLAAVYVRQSVSTIVATDIIDKRVTVEGTFKRTYTNDTTEAITLTDNAASKTTKFFSGGKITWVNSVLQRTADAAMEFATTLTLKAVDAAASALILKAQASSPSTQKLLDVQASGSSTSLASISGTGVLLAANYRQGSGSPEGVVTADKGTIYIDIATTDANVAVWFKMGTNGTNTGWRSLRSYAANESALPTGTVIAFIGDPVANLPAGYLWLSGSTNSATAPDNVALYNLIGTTWGGTAGVNFVVPDFRGRSLVGAGGVLALNLGQFTGNADGLTTLLEANLPPHGHPTIDPGHQHPKPWFPYEWKPPSEPTSLSPMPSNMRPSSALPYMKPEAYGEVDYRATTGITVGNTGSGTPANTLGPVGAVHYLVKL